MKILKLSIILTLLINISAYSQKYYKVELNFTDGHVKSGYAIMPKFKAKQVFFKELEIGKTSSIKSDDLSKISFSIKGKTHIFERGHTEMIFIKNSGKLITNVSKKKRWLYLLIGDPKLNFYVEGTKYKIDEFGEITIINKVSGEIAPIGYYFKKPSKEHFTYITSSVTGVFLNKTIENMFRNAASTYLNDNKELSIRIKNKEFKSNQVFDVYNAYISN